MSVVNVGQPRKVCFINKAQVRQRTSLSYTLMYELMAKGLHPRCIKIGRRSVWVDHEIDEWIAQVASTRGLFRVAK